MGLFGKKKPKPILKTKATHISGLSLPMNTVCKISFYETHLEFEGMNQIFRVAHSKVYTAEMTTAKQFMSQYVSSAGGAVAGGMMFGAVGAMIGGAIKKKTISSFTRLMMFSYTSGNEMKYIVFNADQSGERGKDIVDVYKARRKKAGATITDL